MNPLLTIEKEGEVIKLVARDYIGRNTCLGITHVCGQKTAMGEFLTHSNFPNCMLLEGEQVTLWTVKSVFVGDTISVDTRLYEKYL